jgi:hypothetical protein
MSPRISPYFALLLVFLVGCPQVWPDVVTCEEQNACGTTEPASTGSGGDAHDERRREHGHGRQLGRHGRQLQLGRRS